MRLISSLTSLFIRNFYYIILDYFIYLVLLTRFFFLLTRKNLLVFSFFISVYLDIFSLYFCLQPDTNQRVDKTIPTISIFPKTPYIIIPNITLPKPPQITKFQKPLTRM
jgi:hypothetical protein